MIVVSTASTPRARVPSLGPALIVVAIAVVIVGLGSAVALIGSASAHAPTSQLGAFVPGVGFRAIPAAPFLQHIESGAEPPADIVKSLSVPSGSKYESESSADAGVAQFDRSITFNTSYPPKQVASFYKSELASGHWSIEFDGTAKGDLEMIGQRNGSDGYQWRVALVVSTDNPLISPSLAGSDASPTSTVVMSVYQEVDAS